MSQKSMPEQRDYPDAEPSYDGPDVAYDEIDAEQDNADQVDRDIFNLWSCGQVDTDTGFPAPDVFPDSLFDDLRVSKLVKAGPGHGDS